MASFTERGRAFVAHADKRQAAIQKEKEAQEAKKKTENVGEGNSNTIDIRQDEFQGEGDAADEQTNFWELAAKEQKKLKERNADLINMPVLQRYEETIERFQMLSEVCLHCNSTKYTPNSSIAFKQSILIQAKPIYPLVQK